MCAKYWTLKCMIDFQFIRTGNYNSFLIYRFHWFAAVAKVKDRMIQMREYDYKMQEHPITSWKQQRVTKWCVIGCNVINIHGQSRNYANYAATVVMKTICHLLQNSFFNWRDHFCYRLRVTRRNLKKILLHITIKFLTVAEVEKNRYFSTTIIQLTQMLVTNIS